MSQSAMVVTTEEEEERRRIWAEVGDQLHEADLDEYAEVLADVRALVGVLHALTESTSRLAAVLARARLRLRQG